MTTQKLQEQVNMNQLCFLKKWNVIYMVKFYQNKKVLILGHLIQCLITVITLAILYSVVNTNFVYGLYLSPICLIYSLMQIIIIKKGVTSPKYHWIFQLVCFVTLLPLFLGIYFYIYNPTFKQKFDQGVECKIIKDSKAILQDGSYYENFQVLTVEFTHDGNVYQGCGCGSDKYQETVFQTKIEPFRYVTNDEMTALNIKTQTEDEDISQIKMPSWMCQPYKNYTSNLKDPNTINNKVQIDRCYYNYYGKIQSALSTQDQTDYCKKSNDFIQIIFEEKPFFPLDQFCLLITFILIPFFSLSLNWILVICIHYTIPCLLVDIEKGFFDQNQHVINSKPTNKIIPAQSNNEQQTQQRRSLVIKQEQQQATKNTNISKNNFIKTEDENKLKQNENIMNKDVDKEQQQQLVNKEIQNPQQSEEKNKQLDLIPDIQKSQSNNTQQQIPPIQDIEKAPSSQTNTPSQKINDIFFSMPTLKKKLLPPISINLNIQHILEEKTRKEIEEKKQEIDNGQTSPQTNRKKYRNQQSIDLPDVIISSSPNVRSILQNKEKKDNQNLSIFQQRKSKVQFQEIIQENIINNSNS